MLGFDIVLNFNIPYIARTPSEFWGRWHISLSSWLRDYLYVPLGGNRRGTLLTYRNLMITMLLGGLWHGAAWTFVLWGAFHGAILVVYRMLRVDDWIGQRRGPAFLLRLQDAGLVALMFMLVCIGWLLFRAPDMATVAAFFRGLGGSWSPAVEGQPRTPGRHAAVRAPQCPAICRIRRAGPVLHQDTGVHLFCVLMLPASGTAAPVSSCDAG
jgi:D-alanyl-lipoteichoic acid acyltransferase DltB (MBOAT superfamily)